MQERTLEQERKGLEQGVNNYLCLSAAKKLSKTITFSDKKWSNVVYYTMQFPQDSLYRISFNLYQWQGRLQNNP